MSAFMTEMEIMKKIQHPHCCLFMGAAVDEGKREIKIVTELCAGDMNKLILEDKTVFPLSQRLIWSCQAAQGLAWLHSLLPSPILHRDLKLANLLHDHDMNVKVADFGLAQVTDSGKEVWEKNPRGSLLYMAPEVYLKNHPITTKTDVHSFAMVLWEFCTRREVYEEYFEPASFVTDAFVGSKRPPIDPAWPESLKALFPRMWDPDPKKRLSMTEVVEELEKVIQLVKREERVAFIRSVIPDVRGQEFWIEHYLDLDVVPMETFLTQLYAALALPLPVLDEKQAGHFSLDQRKLGCLRHWLLNPPNAGADIHKFGQLIGWMGPLEIPAPEGAGFLDRLVDLLSQPWFHGLVSADGAANLIRVLPVGSYLVRFSLRTPGGFTMTVNRPTGVVHWIIYNQPGQGFSLDLASQAFFPTIPDLVCRLKEELQLLTPCVCMSPWGFLFQEATGGVSGYTADPRDQSFAAEAALFAAISGGK